MIPILLFFGLCFFGFGDCETTEPIQETSVFMSDPHYLPISEHQLFLDANPSWVFINDTSTRPYPICTDYMESAIGIYCLNEKPRRIDIFNEMIIYDSTHFKTLAEWNLLEFQSNDYEDIHDFLLKCDNKTSTPIIEVLMSEQRTVRVDCLTDIPISLRITEQKSNDEIIIDKLNRIIELLEDKQ